VRSLWNVQAVFFASSAARYFLCTMDSVDSAVNHRLYQAAMAPDVEHEVLPILLRLGVSKFSLHAGCAVELLFT
jgi:hypothetical protein